MVGSCENRTRLRVGGRLWVAVLVLGMFVCTNCVLWAGPATSATAVVAVPTTQTAPAVVPTTKTASVSAPTTKTASAAPTTTSTSATKATTTSLEIPLQYYQIAIEALVVEINEEYSRQIGLQYTYSRNIGPGGTPDPAITRGIDFSGPAQIPSAVVPQMNIIPGGFNFGNETRAAGAGFSLTELDISDGQVGLRLRALIEEGKAQIRSRPMAVTLNKQLVKIETVDKVPYQDVVFASPGSGQMTIQFEPVGVKLHVTPEIKSLQDRLVELDLTKLEVSAVGRFVNLGNVQRPVFLKSEANTKVTVRDHDTLVIGGFKIEHDTRGGRGVPFIRRVPVVKYLFSHESKSLQRRDILFYITPHILRPGVQPTLPPKFEHREALGGDILQLPPAETR